MEIASTSTDLLWWLVFLFWYFINLHIFGNNVIKHGLRSIVRVALVSVHLKHLFCHNVITGIITLKCMNVGGFVVTWLSYQVSCKPISWFKYYKGEQTQGYNDVITK
jgi:hypothetical protein